MYERFIKHKSVFSQYQVMLHSSPTQFPNQDDMEVMRQLSDRYHDDVGDYISSIVGDLRIWRVKIQQL